jgi:hypothetical protein
MKPIKLVLLSLALAGVSAHAVEGDPDREMFRSRIDGVRSELFAEFKAIESYSHHERIRILQEADRCIQAATNRDQYRACEQREKQAREEVQSEVKARHQAMRQKVENLRQTLSRR